VADDFTSTTKLPIAGRSARSRLIDASAATEYKSDREDREGAHTLPGASHGASDLDTSVAGPFSFECSRRNSVQRCR
jgi:hypothetical protein